MQPIEDQSDSVGPDAVAQGRDRRVRRMDGEPAAPHAHGRVVGESDHVEGPGEVGALDRLPMGDLEHAVPEQTDPRRPVVVVEGLCQCGAGRAVVLGDDGGEPENGGHRGTGLLEPDRCLGEGQVDRLVDEGHLVLVVMSGRPTASAVGGTGVVIGLR